MKIQNIGGCPCCKNAARSHNAGELECWHWVDEEDQPALPGKEDIDRGEEVCVGFELIDSLVKKGGKACQQG